MRRLGGLQTFIRSRRQRLGVEEVEPGRHRLQQAKARGGRERGSPDMPDDNAAEALRTAAIDNGQKAPLGSLTLKSEPGPPVKLGIAAGAGARLIISAGIAAIRSSPIPQRWLLGTVPKRRYRLARAADPLEMR
jgi:hypothetical protein